MYRTQWSLPYHVEGRSNLLGVTAVNEALKKTIMIYWQRGKRINLKRCLQRSGKLN